MGRTPGRCGQQLPLGIPGTLLSRSHLGMARALGRGSGGVAVRMGKGFVYVCLCVCGWAWVFGLLQLRFVYSSPWA